MNSSEILREKPEGERWLELIGYGHLKGLPTGHWIDGQPVLTEEFDKLCGEHARPIFTALERIDTNDPKYNEYLKVARKSFEAHMPQGSVEQ